VLCAREVSLKEKEFSESFHIIYNLFECVSKHGFSAEVLLFESIEKALKKGIAPETVDKLTEVFKALEETNRRVISLLMPDRTNLMEIPNLLWTIGWLNLLEDHLMRLKAKYLYNPPPLKQAQNYLKKIDQIKQAYREIRKRLAEIIVEDAANGRSQTPSRLEEHP